MYEILVADIDEIADEIDKKGQEIGHFDCGMSGAEASGRRSVKRLLKVKDGNNKRHKMDPKM